MPLFARARANHHTYLGYTQTVAELERLAAQYPSLVSLYTAQERYGLPSVGTCDGPCRTHVLELTHLPSLARSPRRPDVLVSGAL